MRKGGQQRQQQKRKINATLSNKQNFERRETKLNVKFEMETLFVVIS